MLRVKTLDDSIKTLQIDESQTVTELVKEVCAKIGMYAVSILILLHTSPQIDRYVLSLCAGLYNPEEFSFTIDENPCEQTILGKKSEILNKKQQISKKCKQ